MKVSSILFILFFLASCGQDYNSNSNDASIYEDSGITPGSNLYNAYSVMKTKCFMCHGDWKNYKTSQDWIDHGLIVSGAPTNSDIYNSLIQNGGGMPKSPYSPLTSAEVETLRTWINTP